MTAMPSLPFAGTYPLDAGFWVPASDADEYPWRFGDLVATPESPERFGAVDSKGRPWRAFRAKFTAGMGQQEGAPRPPLGNPPPRTSPGSRGSAPHLRTSRGIRRHPTPAPRSPRREGTCRQKEVTASPSFVYVHKLVRLVNLIQVGLQNQCRNGPQALTILVVGDPRRVGRLEGLQGIEVQRNSDAQSGQGVRRHRGAG